MKNCYNLLIICFILLSNNLCKAQTPTIVLNTDTGCIIKNFYPICSNDSLHPQSFYGALAKKVYIECTNFPPLSIIEVKSEGSDGYLQINNYLINSDTILTVNCQILSQQWLSLNQVFGYRITVTGPNGIVSQVIDTNSTLSPLLKRISGHLFNDLNSDCIQQTNEDTFNAVGYDIGIEPSYSFFPCVFDSIDYNVFVAEEQFVNLSYPAFLDSLYLVGISLTNTCYNAYFQVNNDTIINVGYHSYQYPQDTLIHLTITNTTQNTYQYPTDTVEVKLSFRIIGYNAGDTVKVIYHWDDGSSDTLIVDSALNTSPALSLFHVIQSHIYNNQGFYLVSANVLYAGQTHLISMPTLFVIYTGNPGAHIFAKYYFDQNQNCIKDTNEIYLSYYRINSKDSVPFSGGWHYYTSYNHINFTHIITGGKRALSVDTLDLRYAAGAYLSPCQPVNSTIFTNLGDTIYYDIAVGGYEEALEISYVYTEPVSSTQNNCNDISFSQVNLSYQCPDEFEDTLWANIDFGDGTNYSGPISYSNPNYTISAQDGNCYEHFNTIHNYPGPGNYIYTASYYTDSLSIESPPKLITITPCGLLETHAIIDLDNNCIEGINDEHLAALGFHLDLPQLDYYTYSNSAGIGYFNNFQDSIPYNLIGANYISNGFSYSCPSSGIIIDTTGTTVQIKKLFLTPDPGIDLFSGASAAFLRPGFQFNPFVYAGNHNYTNVFGSTLKVLPEVGINFVSSNPPPTNVINDTLFYYFPQGINCGNFAMVSPAQLAKVYLNFIPDTNLVVNDSIQIETWIVSDSLDINTSNDYSIRKYPVVNSYDPNLLVVSPAGTSTQGLIPNNTMLTYTIHFQNLGNAVAYNIRIFDTLDVNALDLSTLNIIESSHYFNFSILPGNILNIYFNGISLPDSASNPEGSMGHITFTINQQPNLPPGFEIKNRAHIYFDFNESIATNQTLNTIIGLVTTFPQTTNQLNNVTVFPVPSNDCIYYQFLDNFKPLELKLYNATGTLIYESEIINGKISLEQLPKGIYAVQWSDKNGLYRETKIIKN
jgi:hypothetical protein